MAAPLWELNVQRQAVKTGDQATTTDQTVLTTDLTTLLHTLKCHKHGSQEVIETLLRVTQVTNDLSAAGNLPTTYQVFLQSHSS